MSCAGKRRCARKLRQDKRHFRLVLYAQRSSKAGRHQTFPAVLMTDANAPSLGLVGLVSLLFVFIASPRDRRDPVYVESRRVAVPTIFFRHRDRGTMRRSMRS